MLALYFCLYFIMKFLTNDLPNVSSLITEIVRVPFRQYIDAIAMLYSLARSIDQIVEVITIFTNSTVNIGFALYEMELSIVDY